jgi:hypothetical protein
MTLRVECYAGGRADERPIRFQLDSHDYMVEEVLARGAGLLTHSSKCVRMTATCTSCGKTEPRPRVWGVWSRSGSLGRGVC